MVALGRHFPGHDPRSRAYPAPAQPGAPRRPTFWRMPLNPLLPLDQMTDGACTAFSLAHELAAGPTQVPGMTNTWARDMFTHIRATDAAMGNHFDDGATMIAAARTAKARRLISGYRWAFGAAHVLDTLCQIGPVWIGVPWHESMFRTAPDGLIAVSGDVVGGHAVCLAGYDVHPRHGPVALLVNSWGVAYGVPDSRLGLPGGVGYLTVPDLARLLAANGEAIIATDYLPTPPPQPARRPWWRRWWR